MIVFHDYECQQCGHVQEDVISDTQKPVIRATPCTNAPCEGTAIMLFQRVNKFRHDHPALYGHADPQISCRTVIQDHAHKRRLMKERGLIEAEDTHRGVRGFNEHIEDQLPERPKPTGHEAFVVDNLDDIEPNLGKRLTDVDFNLFEK
jgi:hypothetical protein